MHILKVIFCEIIDKQASNRTLGSDFNRRFMLFGFSFISFLILYANLSLFQLSSQSLISLTNSVPITTI